MVYFIGWSLFLIFFKLFLGFKVVGRENVPKRSAFIFASNHSSYLDPILLGTALYRSLNYMARENLFKRRCFGWIMRHLHAFPVKKNTGDLAAIKHALQLLKEDKPLVIFPEGTRSKDKNLKNGKPGIGFMVAKSGVPVIPAYICGSFEALPGDVATFKRHPVSVYIGKPINFDKALLGHKDMVLYQEMSDEIMKRIAELKERHEPR